MPVWRILQSSKMNKKITQLKPKILLMILSMFSTIQYFVADIFITDDQVVQFSNAFGFAYDVICSWNFIFYILIYITNVNNSTLNESLISIIELPAEAYEYIKTHGTILGFGLFKLSSYSHLIDCQFSIFIKSHFLLSFHKSSATIRTAIIAIP